MEDEETLTRLAAGGDRSAFRALFDLTHRDVYAYVRRRAPAPLVEDLVADTYLRALEAIGSFEWRGVPFRAWLFRIAFRLIVDDARKRGRSYPDPDAGADTPVADHGDAVVARVVAQDLLRHLDDLPEPYRTVVELRYVRDWSVPEVAAVLDRKEVTVRTHAHRGLAMLRKKMFGPGDAAEVS